MSTAAQYTVHPAAEAFPMLDAESLNALAEDIAKNGQRIPISVVGNVIIDGRNRLAACEIAGVEPLFAKMKTPPEDIFAYVTSMNIERRHLTTRQRAAIAAELANISRDGTVDGEDRVTLEEAAKRMKVSRKTVSRAKKEKRENPEKHAKAKRGENVRKKAKRKEAPATSDDYANELADMLDRLVAPGVAGGFNQANKKDLSKAARRRLLGALKKVGALVEKQTAKFTLDAEDTAAEVTE